MLYFLESQGPFYFQKSKDQISKVDNTVTPPLLLSVTYRTSSFEITTLAKLQTETKNMETSLK